MHLRYFPAIHTLTNTEGAESLEFRRRAPPLSSLQFFYELQSKSKKENNPKTNQRKKKTQVPTDLGEPLDVLRERPHSAPVVVGEELDHRRVDGVVGRDGPEEVGVLLPVGQDGSGGSEGELGGGKEDRRNTVRDNLEKKGQAMHLDTAAIEPSSQTFCMYLFIVLNAESSASRRISGERRET